MSPQTTRSVWPVLAMLAASVAGCSAGSVEPTLATGTPTTAETPTGEPSFVGDPSATRSGSASPSGTGAASGHATGRPGVSGSNARHTSSGGGTGTGGGGTGGGGTGTGGGGTGGGGTGAGGTGTGGGGTGAGGTGTGGGGTGTGAGGTGTGGGGTGSWWRPAAGLSWQVQYSGTLDTSVAAQVFDVDGSGTTAAQVAQLHAAGRKVICYVDVGASERYRADAARLPASVQGNVMDGWPDERWLDIRQLTVILPVMASRFDECRAKGFDAVDPDNLNGYTNDTGFPLSGADQLRFNKAIADLAHERGLSIGLKNDVEQAAALAASFDFAVNEQCIQYSECDAYRAFTGAGKPVFSIEYQGTPTAVCAVARQFGLTTLIKDLALGAAGHRC